MRALSLWQPWATLVAIGAKRIETRHWRAPGVLIGETFAIHAAKTTLHLPLARQAPFADALGGHGLALGAIIGTARLRACRDIDPALVAELRQAGEHDELAFGNYEHGRVAWILEDPRALTVPVPWKGAQGVFTVPDHIVGVLAVDDNQGRLL